MSVIDGHQFYPSEIADTLAVAANAAMQMYNSTEDSQWLSANVAIVTVKVRINNQADNDANGYSEPELIKKGDPLWSEIDATLAPVAALPEVAGSIAALPLDRGPLAASQVDWLRPALVIGGLGLLGLIGYAWAKK
jgi:hypothetical protein